MAARDDGGSGAARRRRERRLRAFHRHEAMSVRLALATALHHSAQRVEVPREVEEHETNVGLRAQMPPPLGCAAGCSERAGAAAEVGARGLPALADAAGDAVDSATLRFLTAAALKLRQMEEEERKLVELEVKRKESELQSLAAATKVMVQQRAIGSSALARSGQLRRELKELRSEKRKKRKKRKKKLPKTSSGCGRPCGHHRRVPAVRSSGSVHLLTPGIPVVTQRQVPTVHSFMLPVQFLDTVLDMPVAVQRHVLRSMVQKTAAPQLPSIYDRRHSLSFSRRRSSWSRLFSRPQSFLSCCTFQVVDAPVVLVVLAMLRSCRLRQLALMAWLCWLRRASAVFLLIFGIMAGIFQKDSCCGMYKTGYAGCAAPRAVFFSSVRRPMMLGIMAGMDQNDSCCGMHKAGYAGETVEFPQLQFIAGRRLLFRATKADPHGPDCSAVSSRFPRYSPFFGGRSLLCGSSRFSGAAVEKTFVLPQLQLNHKLLCGSACRKLRIFRSCSSSRSLTLPFVTQRLISMVLATMTIPQLYVDKAVNAPIVQVQISFRGVEADSHGPDCLSDHRDSPILLRQGDRCPVVQGVQTVDLLP